jgi:flagellar biosynthesis protein FlhG
LTVVLEEVIKVESKDFSTLQEMLGVIFPEVSNINKRFLMQLTSKHLKNAYMRKAAECHPKTVDGLGQREQKMRQDRYQRLFKAYNTLLPHVKTIQENTRSVEDNWSDPYFPIDRTNRTILAVGGAKGGVGKSVLSANLAVGLSLLGQKVILADLDLGGSDVHLYVGIKSLPKTWNDFLEKRAGASAIEDILTPTAFDGLTLIGGDSSRLGSANLPHAQKQKIIRHLKELDCNYVIIDLGGDTSFNVLDFFLLADYKIVVTGTEPASVLDSYSFIKVAFHRFLEQFLADYQSLNDLRQRIRGGLLNKARATVLQSIFQEIRGKDTSAYVNLMEQFEQFRLSLVVNMAENRKDVRIAESMQRLLKENCLLDVGILGAIPFDKNVRKAARRFTPTVVENPRCHASQVFHQMLAAILLLREPEAVRAELLEKTSLIRKEVKDRIGAGTMTLDGLSTEQIDSIFGRSPRLRQSFQKILSVMGG